jgi:hypothetical protein
MSRWPIRILVCVALCGCQSAQGPDGSRSDADCPTLSPCDDPSSESLLPPGSDLKPAVTQAAWHPIWPGCPTTLQVMARLHPIAFRAVRPLAAPEPDTDPSDWVCDPPEVPLLRAGRWRPDQNLAAR